MSAAIDWECVEMRKSFASVVIICTVLSPDKRTYDTSPHYAGLVNRVYLKLMLAEFYNSHRLGKKSSRSRSNSAYGLTCMVYSQFSLYETVSFVGFPAHSLSPPRHVITRGTTTTKRAWSVVLAEAGEQGAEEERRIEIGGNHHENHEETDLIERQCVREEHGTAAGERCYGGEKHRLTDYVYGFCNVCNHRSTGESRESSKGNYSMRLKSCTFAPVTRLCRFWKLSVNWYATA